MTNYERLVAEAHEHYDLCQRAERIGVPTSLDDPRSPTTVTALRDAVVAAERGGG